MTTKEKVLELFEMNKGIFFSGEEIAQKISVSRAAVWKAVNTLRNEGYSIDAVTNKGYCLSENTDILSPQGIRRYLGPKCNKLNIEVLSRVDSTNALVKEKANQGEDHGYVLISNEQTKGRGRYGRKFFSPEGTGIYMSILLRPEKFSSKEAVRLTTMAAVAMCEAIEEVSGDSAKIKWVNDIYMNKKKVCGILTEASFDMESGLLDYAVIGAGVNIFHPKEGFPEEISETAGAVFDDEKNDVKNRLAGAFLTDFMEYYTADNPKEYIDKYRNRNIAVGKQIKVISGDTTRDAYAYDIDEECRLLVRYADGEQEALSYGEIQIKL